MSRYSGNSDECPSCGTTYGRFRTGFRYRDVLLMLWDWKDDDRSQWRYKRRGTVLGTFHQLKKELWSRHVEECDLPF